MKIDKSRLGKQIYNIFTKGQPIWFDGDNAEDVPTEPVVPPKNELKKPEEYPTDIDFVFNGEVIHVAHIPAGTDVPDLDSLIPAGYKSLNLRPVVSSGSKNRVVVVYDVYHVEFKYMKNGKIFKKVKKDFQYGTVINDKSLIDWPVRDDGTYYEPAEKFYPFIVGETSTIRETERIINLTDAIGSETPDAGFEKDKYKIHYTYPDGTEKVVEQFVKKGQPPVVEAPNKFRFTNENSPWTRNQDNPFEVYVSLSPAYKHRYVWSISVSVNGYKNEVVTDFITNQTIDGVKELGVWPQEDLEEPLFDATSNGLRARINTYFAEQVKPNVAGVNNIWSEVGEEAHNGREEVVISNGVKLHRMAVKLLCVRDGETFKEFRLKESVAWKYDYRPSAADGDNMMHRIDYAFLNVDESIAGKLKDTISNHEDKLITDSSVRYKAREKFSFEVFEVRGGTMTQLGSKVTDYLTTDTLTDIIIAHKPEYIHKPSVTYTDVFAKDNDVDILVKVYGRKDVLGRVFEFVPVALCDNGLRYNFFIYSISPESDKYSRQHHLPLLSNFPLYVKSVTDYPEYNYEDINGNRSVNIGNNDKYYFINRDGMDTPDTLSRFNSKMSIGSYQALSDGVKIYPVVNYSGSICYVARSFEDYKYYLDHADNMVMVFDTIMDGCVKGVTMPDNDDLKLNLYWFAGDSPVKMNIDLDNYNKSSYSGDKITADDLRERNIKLVKTSIRYNPKGKINYSNGLSISLIPNYEKVGTYYLIENGVIHNIFDNELSDNSTLLPGIYNIGNRRSFKTQLINLILKNVHRDATSNILSSSSDILLDDDRSVIRFWDINKYIDMKKSDPEIAYKHTRLEYIPFGDVLNSVKDTDMHYMIDFVNSNGYTDRYVPGLPAKMTAFRKVIHNTGAEIYSTFSGLEHSDKLSKSQPLTILVPFISCNDLIANVNAFIDIDLSIPILRWYFNITGKAANWPSETEQLNEDLSYGYGFLLFDHMKEWEHFTEHLNTPLIFVLDKTHFTYKKSQLMIQNIDRVEYNLPIEPEHRIVLSALSRSMCNLIYKHTYNGNETHYFGWLTFKDEHRTTENKLFNVSNIYNYNANDSKSESAIEPNSIDRYSIPYLMTDKTFDLFKYRVDLNSWDKNVVLGLYAPPGINIDANPEGEYDSYAVGGRARYVDDLYSLCLVIIDDLHLTGHNEDAPAYAAIPIYFGRVFNPLLLLNPHELELNLSDYYDIVIRDIVAPAIKEYTKDWKITIPGTERIYKVASVTDANIRSRSNIYEYIRRIGGVSRFCHVLRVGVNLVEIEESESNISFDVFASSENTPYVDTLGHAFGYDNYIFGALLPRANSSNSILRLFGYVQQYGINKKYIQDDVTVTATADGLYDIIIPAKLANGTIYGAKLYVKDFTEGDYIARWNTLQEVPRDIPFFMPPKHGGVKLIDPVDTTKENPPRNTLFTEACFLDNCGVEISEEEV